MERKFKTCFIIFLLFWLNSMVFSYNVDNKFFSKMEEVKENLGFNDNYIPKYFDSPADFVNVLNNNELHFKNTIFTINDSPISVTPVKIAWDIYIGKDDNGNEAAPDFAIVLIPGSAGSYIKFSEYMYDLQKASGQKIAFFMMDNRGQGFSTWFNPNNKEGFNGLYVDSFDNYISDLKFFFSYIVKPEVARLEKKYNKKIPIFAFGHSLGGGIIARYMELFSYDFTGAILSSPAIKALSWPQRPLAFWSIYGIIKQGGGAFYVPTGDDIHETQLFDSVFCQASNKDRWYYWQMFQSPKYFKNKTLIHPNSGGEVLRMSYPTYWWTYQLIKGTNPITDIENTTQLRAPYIILQAEDDKLVSLDAMRDFLKRTPWGLGKLIEFPNAKHDIMFEENNNRSKSISEIINFLHSYPLQKKKLFSNELFLSE